ncbi:MAG: SLC13 family permease, partial [Myxococcota bacterium]
AVIYLVTMLTTEVVTNNAAVALVFPIAQATATQLGVDFMPFVIAIMMAGSASFAMPLGYQTNLMVYGPGGYSILDFLKIGVLMNLLLAASCITITPMIFPF